MNLRSPNRRRNRILFAAGADNKHGVIKRRGYAENIAQKIFIKFVKKHLTNITKGDIIPSQFGKITISRKRVYIQLHLASASLHITITFFIYKS